MDGHLVGTRRPFQPMQVGGMIGFGEEAIFAIVAR